MKQRMKKTQKESKTGRMIRQVTKGAMTHGIPELKSLQGFGKKNSSWFRNLSLVDLFPT